MLCPRGLPARARSGRRFCKLHARGPRPRGRARRPSWLRRLHRVMLRRPPPPGQSRDRRGRDSAGTGIFTDVVVISSGGVVFHNIIWRVQVYFVFIFSQISYRKMIIFSFIN